MFTIQYRTGKMLSQKAYMVKWGSRQLIQILNSAHLSKAVATEESRVCQKCPAAAAASTDSINCSAGHQDKEWKEGRRDREQVSSATFNWRLQSLHPSEFGRQSWHERRLRVWWWMLFRIVSKKVTDKTLCSVFCRFSKSKRKWPSLMIEVIWRPV